MSQYPDGGPQNYNPYEPNQPYPQKPGSQETAYGGGPPPFASNPPPESAPNTPHSNYGNFSPYTPPPPPPDPGMATNPYDPYGPTIPSHPHPPMSYPSTPPPIPPDRPWWKKSRRSVVLASVIALILLIGGIIFGIVAYNNNQNAMHASATAVANAHATTTAQSNATATAVASTYPFSNRLVFSDPMDGSGKGMNWDNDKYCKFSGSAYHVSDDEANTHNACFGSGQTFTNFTFQAQMIINQGDDTTGAGLVFRADKAMHKLYAFFLNDQGACGIVVTVDTGGANNRDLTPQGCQAGQFNTGPGETNTVAVVAKNDQLSFYVNQQQVTSVSDSTFSHGQIGFIVVNGNSKVAEAIFTNVKIWAL